MKRYVVLLIILGLALGIDQAHAVPFSTGQQAQVEASVIIDDQTTSNRSLGTTETATAHTVTADASSSVDLVAGVLKNKAVGSMFAGARSTGWES